VSEDRKVLYRKSLAGNAARQFVWIDRQGKELEKVGMPVDSQAGSLSAAVGKVAFSTADVHLLDLGRRTVDRFTTDAEVEAMPVLSPDGKQIVYTSNRNGAWHIFRSSVNAPGPADVLVKSGRVDVPTGWSKDSRHLLYRTGEPGKWDIWVLPFDGNGALGGARAVLQTDADERDAEFAPDGKWIVYQTNKTGRYEIYAQPFPGPGAAVPISTDGGTQAQWRDDGKEIFYIGRDGKLYAVSVQASVAALELGTPVPLFNSGIGLTDGINRRFYNASPDGQKFLVAASVERPTSPITVLLNWKARPPEK
jgi:Tol biopolymer transport system component